jgi:hypothetical protein
MSTVDRYIFRVKFSRHSANEEISSAGLYTHPEGDYVKYSDYKYLSDYCDHLVSFSKLPCLPKDLENLRESNAFFATENQQLKDEIERLKQAI